MEIPCQTQQQLVDVANVNGAASTSISSTICEGRLKTLVEYSNTEQDNSSWCLRKELLVALVCLDNIEKSVTGVSISCDKEKRKDSIDLEKQDCYPERRNEHEDDSDLNIENKLHSCNFSEDGENQIVIRKDENYISDQSSSIEELMERIKASDRNLLDIQRENEILKQSLEAAVLENECLKEDNLRVRTDLKSATEEKHDLQKELDQIKDGDVHQACKDKIAALRSVARALENENELLLEQTKHLESRNSLDKHGASIDTSQQMQLKELEIKELTAKYEQKKTENAKLMSRIIVIEKELETERIFGRNVMTRLSDLQETHEAVKHGKRSVESNLQLIVEQNESLQKKVHDMELQEDNLKQTNAKLEKQISEHTETTSLFSTTTENFEQEIAMQASIYEDKIESMQREMNERLEEMTVSQAGDAENVRIQYVDLFDEKANELHVLRKEYEKQSSRLQEIEQRLADQELIEQENKEKMETSRKCHNEELSSSLSTAQGEIASLQSHTLEMEQELQSLRKRYDDLQLSYLNAIAHFKSRLIKVNQLEDSEGSMLSVSQVVSEEEPRDTEPSLVDNLDQDIYEDPRTPMSSSDDYPLEELAVEDENNRDQIESGDDDSGIKVEMSEPSQSSNTESKEIHQSNIDRIPTQDEVDTKESRKDFPEVDQIISSPDPVVTKSSLKSDYGKCNIRNRKTRRKRK